MAGLPFGGAGIRTEALPLSVPLRDKNANFFVGVGTDPGHASSIAYVDDSIAALSGGIDWQESVLDQSLTAPPVGPIAGDRYIIAAVASGAWLGHDEEIAEWSGAAWVFTTPDKGTALYVEDEGRVFLYNGDHPAGTWANFGFTIYEGSNTPGSVMFVGASGLLAQDNAKLFWDNTNKRLGIGTTAPLNPLHVVGAGMYERSLAGSGTFFELYNPNTTDGNGAQLAMRATRTGASTADIDIANIGFQVDTHDAATYKSSILFSVSTGGVGPIAKMRLTGDGFLGIGTTDPASLLHVFGASTATFQRDNAVLVQPLTLRNDNTTVNSGAGFNFFGKTTANGGVDYAQIGALFVGHVAGSLASSLIFKTPNEADAGAAFIRLTLDKDGLVTLFPSGTPQGSASTKQLSISGTTQTITFNPNQTGGVNSWQLHVKTLAQNSAATIGNATTLKIDGSPAVGANATITNAYALWAASGNVRFDGRIFVGGLTGGTAGEQVGIQPNLVPTGTAAAKATHLNLVASSIINFATTPQTGDVSTVLIGQQTYTNPSAGLIPFAATLKLAGPPIASTLVTFTAAYAFWIAAGNSRHDGNSLFGSAAAVGTNGVGVLALGNGTEPTTSPIDTAQLYSVDNNGAGTATLGIRTEQAEAAQVVASTHTLRVKVNGTVYGILLTNAPT